MSQSENFGELLSQGLQSIAFHEGKHRKDIKIEWANEWGLEHWIVDRYLRKEEPNVPTDPKRVAIMAEDCVKRGKLDKQWLDVFLTSARYSDKNTLMQKLFPGKDLVISTNLPSRPYERLVGRKDQLEQLFKYLSPQHRIGVVRLTGQAGVGKTAIALEIAHRLWKSTKLSDEYRFEGIVWVSAQRELLTPKGIISKHPTLSDLNSLYRALQLVLGLQAIESATTLGERAIIVNQYLAEHRILIVLDNFEDIDDEHIIAFLIELPSPSKAILTTRHRVGVAVSIPVEAFKNYDDARDLVKEECDRLSEIEHKLSLTDEQIEKLLQYSGGLPLAIVHALGRMAWQDSSIESEIGYLEDPTKDISQIYQFSFQRSIGLIRGKPAHKLFMALMLFSGDASREALGGIAGFENDHDRRDQGLNDLVVLSLVNKTGDRFSLDVLAKMQAREELKAYPEFRQDAIRQLVKYYLKFVKQHGGKDWMWWHKKYDLLQEEWKNLIAIFELCIALQKEDDFYYSALKDFWQSGGVLYFAHLYGHWDDRITYLTKLAHRAENRGEWSTWVEATVDMAYSLMMRGQLEDADKNFALAWKGRESADYAEQTKLTEYMGRLRVYQRNFEDAAIWLKEASNLLDKASLADPERSRRQVTILNYYGLMCYEKGNYAAAEEYFNEVVARAGKIELQRTALFAQNYLADIAIEQGDLDKAERIIKEGLNVSERNKADRFTATFQRSYAYLFAKRGDLEKASKWAKQALDNFKRLGMKREIDEMSGLLESLGLA